MESLATVDKAVDLLFHLHARSEACGASEVGRALGLPRSSAHRLLTTLARRGLLERDVHGRYRPGAALIALGLGALDREPIVQLALPVLEAEATLLGETVFLTAARAGRIVVLAKVEGTGFLRAAPRVGSTVPIHATAVGKLALAFAPESVPLGQEPLEAYTEATPRTRAALDREVERVRQVGFAENRGEWIPGLRVIAAPVFAGGRMVGALALAVPEVRMEALDRDVVARRMIAAAEGIGARLDGSAHAPDKGEEEG
jgi:IclR family acetate operon transcriptional repressor